MGRLIATSTMSLDGYVADAEGHFEWAAPDEEVHQFVDDLERDAGTYLYGRRLYETMRVWQEPGWDQSESAAVRDYAAMWRAADKVVFSRTLEEVTTPRTRLVREFDPGEVRTLVAEARTDVSIGGAELAGVALRAGLVDELRVFLVPELVGGGTSAWPNGVRVSLRLLEQRLFGDRIYARHAVG
jgi:dihydrofolate reductase